MASALQNPTDHRRINKIARAMQKSGGPSTAKQAVGQWLAASKLDKLERPGWMQRDVKFANAIKAGTVDFSRLKKTSAADRTALARDRKAITHEFEIQGTGYGQGKPRQSKKGKALPGLTYQQRASGTHASRYLRQATNTKVTGGRTTKSGKVLRGKRRNVAHIQAWNSTRQGRRATKSYGKTIPWSTEYGQGMTKHRHEHPFGDVYPDAVLRADGSILLKAAGGKRQAKPARPGKRGGKRAVANRGHARKNGLALSNGLALKNGLALTNGLALANPTVKGAKAYFLGYAIPVTVAGAAAGGIHAMAASSGVTEKIAAFVGKIPVVGEKIAYNAPFTLQGLIIGSGLGLLAPMVGGVAGKYLALAGGAALVVGGGIDTFNYLSFPSDAEFDADLDMDISSELDDVDFDAEGPDALALGDLALTNGFSLGDLAFTNGLGDGMAYETAPLSAAPSSDDYGQSSLVDAQYSGADFSAEEGQALLNGRRSFAQRFGNAPVRMSGRSSAGPSHLAGREGHRWGWLVRMIGWDKAQAIAAMPPTRRVQFLKKLRSAAIASYTQLMNEANAMRVEAHSPNPEFINSSAGFGASGSQGPGTAQGAEVNYLGEPALFMGA
jgi:hypothetical protein